ncbi:Protein phosphatase 1 regulatory subunit SDS22 [Taphrina deformans PYCC 5710]|uniref:prephenate dehydratase n=1 Tax=Taphrina deformans (strain PYCC 5710 / ATCC 11124 / CBS 356.35 / IMI 108563 / JCM 9778 / NBRC 8474) TaxID=1097556 RepID=R4X788_TAPDE|nr:Protein phosphatase 1 regulatory subunit SDS22 [Taphrina deformans PYCC 5710]|eukprot:CCG81156.1 Protein phosphatase 1 regulatory subunit SDS22 [Taphrina deformans PYCC 5710]
MPNAGTNRGTVAYLGPKGTFTYQAARQTFGEDVTYQPVPNLADILDAVKTGKAEHGVLPFENSSNGHVTPSLDLLRSLDIEALQVVGEVYLDVHQCLLSSTSLDRIKRLYSHPQAFGQCEEYLSTNLPGIERINVSSTGKAAQTAAEDSESAAIASSSSAEAVGIQILASDIEDNKNNTTRFLIFSHDPLEYDAKQTYKTLISFTVPHSRPGSLAQTLQRFSEASINLTSISSRPNVSKEVLGSGQKWVYVFFVELEGHAQDEKVAHALQQVKTTESAEQVTILGSFVDVRRTSPVARLRGGSGQEPTDEPNTAMKTIQRPNTRDEVSDDEAEDAEDVNEGRPTEIIEGEQISADEDILDDYPKDTDDIACLHSRVRSIVNLHLERFPRLKTLCLRQNAITKLQGLPSTLTELDLYDNLIGHMDGLDALHDLASLDLSFNKIKHIKQVNHMKHLTTLYLVQNKIGRIENLEGLSSLTMLELGANRIREIENLETLSNLEELWLGKNKITELKNLTSLPKLRILSIQSNRLTNITNLEGLADCLEELYISHNGLTELSGLAPLKKLRVLDISNNKITNLTHLAHLTDLEELWASNNLLESFDEIQTECKHLLKLDTVYFEGNPMQRKNATTYRNKVRLSVHAGIKQIDANMLR